MVSMKQQLDIKTENKSAYSYQRTSPDKLKINFRKQPIRVGVEFMPVMNKLSALIQKEKYLRKMHRCKRPIHTHKSASTPEKH